MNPLNDEDRDTSNCVRNSFMRIVADNMKRNVVGGFYCCAGDAGKSAKLNCFLGSKILTSNLIIAVANQTFHPTPALLAQ